MCNLWNSQIKNLLVLVVHFIRLPTFQFQNPGELMRLTLFIIYEAQNKPPTAPH